VPEKHAPSFLLAHFLLGESEQAHAAAHEMSQRGLWYNAVRLAFSWRVLPRLRERVSYLSVDMPKPARSSLASVSAAAAAESAMVCHGALAAIGALEEAEIRAAAFKGLGMIVSVYGSPGRRMLSDADVLVEKEDFRAASVALREAGFKPAISIGLDEWLELLEERVYPAHDFMDFVNDAGVRMDVHWRLRTPSDHGFSIGDILDQSVVMPLGAKSIRVVSPEDSLVLTAHHLVRDRFAPRSAVKDMTDISAWLDVMDDLWTIDSLELRARDAGLSTSLLAALSILAGLAPEGRASNVAARIRGGCNEREKKAAERLAALFTLQLRGAQISGIVVGMAAATPSLVGRFILSRLRSLTDASYRRNKFPGGEPPRPMAELRTFFHDVLTLTPSRFAQYRALATETRRYLGAEDGSS